MSDGMTPEEIGAPDFLLDERAALRRSHPTFSRVDEILVALLIDDSVSPPVYDLVTEAVFTALMAYVDAKQAIEHVIEDRATPGWIKSYLRGRAA